MNIKQLDDSVFEALFRQAVIDEYKEEIESIPQKKELMRIVSLSPEFEIRMKLLFDNDRKRDIYIKFMHYGKRVAVVFLLAVTILSLVLLTNPEVRAAIKNTIIEWYDKYTSIIFHGKEEADNDIDETKEFVFEYIPEGFSESWVERLGKITDMEYVNDQGETIYISYWPDTINTNISIDNENHIIESTTISGYEAYTAEATNEDFDNGIIWSMEGYRFNIWSKQPIKELIKIIESITW
ncbi:MAG: DUF4367 domain-containing protein [Clostridiales bacterium]|jgi:hypothetical protein|nr:DUF4367 domain-containing protein [Clostridiales bacterium]